jgi:hypothetical protein
LPNPRNATSWTPDPPFAVPSGAMRDGRWVTTRVTAALSRSIFVIEAVLTEEERKKALVLSVKNPLSSMFINNGKGQFQVTALPLPAQLSPLYAIVVEDFNDDGKKDLFVAGNFSGVRPEIGGYDANSGQVYLGDGNNHFTFIPNKFSGVNIRGEARDAIVVKGKNGKKAILVTMNNGQPYLYQVN